MDIYHQLRNAGFDGIDENDLREENPRDEYGFRMVTDFGHNTIALDPPACVCVACRVGHAIPFESWRMPKLAEAMGNTGKQIVNRSGIDVALVKTFTGVYVLRPVQQTHTIITIAPDTGGAPRDDR